MIGIDFGTGINKYKGKYCYEILNFAEGFDLLSVESLKGKYSFDFIGMLLLVIVRKLRLLT